MGAFAESNDFYFATGQFAKVSDCKGSSSDRAFFVIGATNQPGRVNPAVKRAGRLDREIEIEKPDAKTLAKIFRHHLGDQLSGADHMPTALAARGATGADVEASSVRRARGAARRARRLLQVDDLLAAVRSRREPPSRDEPRRLAVHKAGHVVAATLLGCLEVASVSISDRDPLLGSRNS